MSSPAILAIDQGTTNTKALLVSPDGTILARASRPMTLTHPQPGWAEQSADAIWDSVADAIADVVTQVDARVVAVAISNQRETAVLWDAVTGRPLAPAISWQCRRSYDRCATLRKAGHEAAVIALSGLNLDPLFPAAKLAWLLDSVPGARERAGSGELQAGTIDSWLVWNLTGGGSHVTDTGNAARTQLLDLHSADWSVELAELFDVPIAMLPQVQPSDSHFGDTAAGRTILPAGIPIHAVMGDSHAALFGHGLSEPGAAKVTIGTGSSIMALTDVPATSHSGLSSTIAWRRGDEVTYALEGNITVSGQAAAFATRLLGLADENALTALAQTVSDSGGVAFVPALAGLGAPHWDSEARGMIAGMTLGTGPAHIARATLEAIAMQIVDVSLAMEADTNRVIPTVSVDGGATRNAFLLQLLADLLDRPVLRRADPELSALGVARMAAEALGLALPVSGGHDTERFDPAMSVADRERVAAKWHRAVQRATAHD
ncbi:glycerol kinase [Sphingomonas gellani]|uniref:ATP:glycerol 3-phosphotransferase n=1 Tax=Sphingomonas gellani TaxID=1166340 RepID=A0A1H8JVQ8_9SPHN|nr:FGGY family carbohydrate kinase [Sphingomonas gellani]SEN84298.1 glycerol kinase [Sphingomonas gellani]